MPSPRDIDPSDAVPPGVAPAVPPPPKPEDEAVRRKLEELRPRPEPGNRPDTP